MSHIIISYNQSINFYFQTHGPINYTYTNNNSTLRTENTLMPVFPHGWLVGNRFLNSAWNVFTPTLQSSSLALLHLGFLSIIIGSLEFLDASPFILCPEGGSIQWSTVCFKQAYFNLIWTPVESCSNHRKKIARLQVLNGGRSQWMGPRWLTVVQMIALLTAGEGVEIEDGQSRSFISL